MHDKNLILLLGHNVLKNMKNAGRNRFFLLEQQCSQKYEKCKPDLIFFIGTTMFSKI